MNDKQALWKRSLLLLAGTAVLAAAPAQAQIVIDSGSIRIGSPHTIDRFSSSVYYESNPASGSVYYEPYGGPRYTHRTPRVYTNRIEDSTLINPVIIGAPIEDSVLINPVIVPRSRRTVIRPSHSIRRAESSCTLFADLRPACW